MSGRLVMGAGIHDARSHVHVSLSVAVVVRLTS